MLQNQRRALLTSHPICKPKILIYFGYGHLPMTQGPLLFPEHPQKAFGVSMQHPKKRQGEKERVSSISGIAGCGRSRNGSGTGTDSYEAGKFGF